MLDPCSEDICVFCFDIYLHVVFGRCDLHVIFEGKGKKNETRLKTEEKRRVEKRKVTKKKRKKRKYRKEKGKEKEERKRRRKEKAVLHSVYPCAK